MLGGFYTSWAEGTCGVACITVLCVAIVNAQLVYLEID
jgi:hypothetical protein